MTCKQKFHLEHPDIPPKKLRPEWEGGCQGCPTDYGYRKEKPCEDGFYSADCEVCWNLEVEEAQTA